MAENQSGTGKDPMAQLDAAMQETFQELAREGNGVSPADVARQITPERAPRRRQSSDDESWGGQAEQRPRRQPTRQRATQDDDDDAANVILEEADTEAQDAARGRPRRQGQRETPERGPDGRFLPSQSATDAEDDDYEDDEVDARADGRRYAEPEEAGAVDEDDDYEPEGRGRAGDDEDEETDRQGRPRRRRFPSAMRREIERQVEARVSKVVEERDRLRQAQAETQRIEAGAIDTLVRAIGTQQQRDQLQQIVNDPRAPLDQRNRAAATLNRYRSNEQYVQTYRTALLAADRQQKANRRQEAITHLGKYQIQLDPRIVHAGDDANTMAHVARQAILAERARAGAEIERLKRQVATLGGSADERSVRNGRIGRDSMASSNGRRANGRVAAPDPLRRAMGYDRGLGAEDRVPMPTDAVLKQLRDGEITLRDLGLG